MTDQFIPQQGGMREQFADAQVSIGTPWRVLIISFIIFALAIFIELGLAFGYEGYLNGKIAAADSQIQTLAASVAQKQQEFVTFYSQVVNLKSVLEKRSFTANVFTFLERNVIAPVYFTEADISTPRQEVALKGFAPTLGDLSRQIAVIEADQKNVKDVVLNEVNLQGGGVGFSFTITFTPDFFKRPLTP
ncbi:MAG: hypothetical protein Q7R98_03685 [Candidatus Jorgensenbacteria bacterium]|nr:hypothetical protein [Candidatus Jorgensenbacteria bacterium]